MSLGLHHSSVGRSSSLILKTIKSKYTAVRVKKPNPTQPSANALVPTPFFTAPHPNSRDVIAAATEAVCCHVIDTNTRVEASVEAASAANDTSLEGNGFTSRMLPSSSSSSCQPEKLRSKQIIIKASATAAILEAVR